MMKRKVFCALLALMLLLSACTPGAEQEATPGTTDKPNSGSTQEPTPTPTPEPTPDSTPSGEVIASGDCGENVTWTLDSNGLLTISGTGSMKSYSFDPPLIEYKLTPWNEYRDRITKAVIEDGVTSIGYDAFYGCEKLTSVTIPDSVTYIGMRAFEGCSLTDVFYRGSAEQWSQIEEMGSGNNSLLNATFHYDS